MKEITCIRKIRNNPAFKDDTFEYRDMYNDIKTISFPKIWDMTEDDVEEYLMTESDRE